MPNPNDFPARGKVSSVDGDRVVFAPAGTNYQIHLLGRYDGPIGERMACVIRAKARKIWTVPSGGNFLAPIFGPPKTIQGRIKYLDERQMVVQAGTAVVVDLPADERVYDLVNGPLTVGALVNISALPGASLELLPEPSTAQ